ncbi:protein fuzzy homolog [Physella acuta]|uniref:protein fuzzy homolog n=1 Tax=Physella acuta TaxID=109671 RepID=UPI0027DD3689|nr:protein fuzzy homolog [Physella acuta]XP_059152758.1 protein fuzzy homolog [Physella acuta]
MAAYLICLTSGSGLPVFTRSVGNLKPLPFPVIGSLNAVHMFAANHDAVLQSTTTDDARIVWKDFHNSLVLIAVVSRDSAADDVHVGRLLENVFHSLVLLYGLEELVNIKNVERFKKEIRICFQLVDTLLQQSTLTLFSDLTNAVDVLIPAETSVLQNFLEAFVEAAGSPYGCLMAHGRVIVATSKWWDLTSTELVLLSLLLSSFSECSSRDVPIYLPQGSPNIPHRLLTFELLRHVEVCLICGPTPSLTDMEREIGRFWTPALDNLRSARQLHPRNFPTSIEVDNNILGFLLVNSRANRCLNSVNLPRERDDPVKMEKRRALLRSFYKHVVGTYFSNSNPATEKGPSEFSHQVMDTYIVCSGHKCYAHTSGPHQIFILFSSQIPTFAMRSVSQKTLDLFIKDKNFRI